MAKYCKRANMSMEGKGRSRIHPFLTLDYVREATRESGSLVDDCGLGGGGRSIRIVSIRRIRK